VSGFDADAGFLSEGWVTRSLLMMIGGMRCPSLTVAFEMRRFKPKWKVSRFLWRVPHEYSNRLITSGLAACIDINIQVWGFSHLR